MTCPGCLTAVTDTHRCLDPEDRRAARAAQASVWVEEQEESA